MPELVTGGHTGNFVLGKDGTRLFLAGADGKLRVFEAQTGKHLTTWDVGKNLGGIAISPDGSYLLVAEQVPVDQTPGSSYEATTTSAVYKIDTSTGSLQILTHRSTGGNFAVEDVAITTAGSAFITLGNLQGQLGPERVLTLDVPSSTFKNFDGFGLPDAVVLAASDGQSVLMGSTSTSSQTYTFSPQGIRLAQGYIPGTSEGNAPGAEAHTGSGPSGHIAMVRGGSVHLFDGNLEYRANLTQALPHLESITALSFSKDGNILYAASASNDRLYAIDMATMQTSGVSLAGFDPITSKWGDELILSPDGSSYYLLTTQGVMRGALPGTVGSGEMEMTTSPGPYVNSLAATAWTSTSVTYSFPTASTSSRDIRTGNHSTTSRV